MLSRACPTIHGTHPAGLIHLGSGSVLHGIPKRPVVGADPPSVRLVSRKTLRKAVDELCSRDTDLRRVVQKFGPPLLWARRPTFATLLRIILEQQVSLASAESTFRRLQDAVGRIIPETVARRSLAEIRRLGFTGQKAGYCLDLARRIEAGGLNLRKVSRADDDDVRAALLEMRGIGPCTADIYLLMALRRADVWPDGDLALANAVRGVKRLRTRPTPERLRRIASRWRPWRSVAARILWHHYLSERSEATDQTAGRRPSVASRPAARLLAH